MQLNHNQSTIKSLSHYDFYPLKSRLLFSIIDERKIQLFLKLIQTIQSMQVMTKYCLSSQEAFRK